MAMPVTTALLILCTVIVSQLPYVEGFLKPPPLLQQTKYHSRSHRASTFTSSSLPILAPSMARGPIRYTRKRAAHTSVQTLAKTTSAAHDIASVDNAQEVKKNLDAQQLEKIDEQGCFETATHELSQPWWEEETEMSFYDGEGRRHVFKGK